MLSTFEKDSTYKNSKNLAEEEPIMLDTPLSFVRIRIKIVRAQLKLNKIT